MADRSGRETAAGEAFWRFSLALYARPGVADALIGLQDRAGRDVNLILFALWAGACRGRELTPAEFADAGAAVAGLTSVIGSVRALRRRLRDAADPDLRALRRGLLRLELAAERRVQRRLAAFATDRPPAGRDDGRREPAEANLALYLGGEAESPEAGALRRAAAALTRRA